MTQIRRWLDFKRRTCQTGTTTREREPMTTCTHCGCPVESGVCTDPSCPMSSKTGR